MKFGPLFFERGKGTPSPRTLEEFSREVGVAYWSMSALPCKHEDFPKPLPGLKTTSKRKYYCHADLRAWWKKHKVAKA